MCSWVSNSGWMWVCVSMFWHLFLRLLATSTGAETKIWQSDPQFFFSSSSVFFLRHKLLSLTTLLCMKKWTSFFVRLSLMIFNLFNFTFYCFLFIIISLHRDNFCWVNVFRGHRVTGKLNVHQLLSLQVKACVPWTGKVTQVKVNGDLASANGSGTKSESLTIQYNEQGESSGEEEKK